MRTIVALPLDQVDTLDALCRQSGISRAEGVRRAVAEHLARHASADRDRAFGLWRKTPIDGVRYQRGVRREWPR